MLREQRARRVIERKETQVGRGLRELRARNDEPAPRQPRARSSARLPRSRRRRVTTPNTRWPRRAGRRLRPQGFVPQPSDLVERAIRRSERRALAINPDARRRLRRARAGLPRARPRRRGDRGDPARDRPSRPTTMARRRSPAPTSSARGDFREAAAEYEKALGANPDGRLRRAPALALLRLPRRIRARRADRAPGDRAPGEVPLGARGHAGRRGVRDGSATSTTGRAATTTRSPSTSASLSSCASPTTASASACRSRSTRSSGSAYVRLGHHDDARGPSRRR